MRSQRCRTTVLCVLFWGALGAAAAGEPNWGWITPCVGGLTCVDKCSPLGGPPCPVCHCEGDWNSTSRWEWIGGCGSTGGQCVPLPGYPAATNHHPIVEKSNTGTCSGGSNDGLACSEASDCPDGSCEDLEEWLQINLSTETVGDLTVKTASTPASTDYLIVLLHSQSSGGDTLTVSTVTIDSTNGSAELSVGDEAELKTDTTD